MSGGAFQDPEPHGEGEMKNARGRPPCRSQLVEEKPGKEIEKEQPEPRETRAVGGRVLRAWVMA